MERVWLFPIHFKSEIKREISIDEDIKLRRITEEEIYKFFNIRVTERIGEGIIKSFSGKGLEPTDPFSAIILNHKVFFMSSQFIVEAKDIKCAECFQQALKLHKDGKTGMFCGLNSKTEQLRVLHPIPFYGKEVYNLKEEDIPKIKELYNIIKKTHNKKYDLIIEKFLFAVSGIEFKNEHRFLELVSILEILYLKDINTELKFRLSLRVAKVFSKYLSMNSEEVYENMKKIYDIRSKISHSGFHEDTGDYLDKLTDYVRESIKLFLKDNLIFENKNLDELCVK